jgi:hypothetical protein
MRPLVLAPLTVVLVLALPSAAGAVIVPQEGLKGLTLGMTVDDVRGVLGKPDRFRTVRSENAGPLREWRYGLTRVTFDGTAPDAKVLSLDTRSRAERTAAGVGVGSRKATIKRKVPKVRCLVEFSYDHCFIGAFRAGEIVTDFAIGRTGKVTRVTVGRVLD